ncbi:uncharacterized protein LOC121535129 [Coregonus clupeaformis]|uniref:uncharacterized protein LOC123481576 n=1 Tax=Coregonus clupeaformis TaxID=59861 RepID=UPI001E1C7EE2|nr:uncharacterized protein LOC123481576 [Coregonus clupeaformis]XP_045062017.1 uncharacterized protein LOC121535129 [Coregonus clupeaformis]
MAQLSQKGGLCNMKMLLLAVIFCLLSPVAANVLVSSEHKTLMPVKDHPILNNPDATKEQVDSLRVKEYSSPGNVGQLTKGYSSKNVKDPPDFVEPLISVPEHKPLMPVKDHSVQNNPDATKETNFKSLLEQLESLRVKDDSSPEHRPLMPVKDHPVQDIPNDAKWTKMVQVDQMLEQLQRMKDDTFPGKAKVPQMIVEKRIPYLQAYKQKALQGDNNIFKENLQAPAPKAQKSTLKIKPRVNILTDPSYSEPLVKVNLILGLVFYGFIVIVVLYDAVRISKEARRRSDAIATARLKKREPATAEPQTLASRVRESISSRFGLKQASSTPQCAPISDDSAKELQKSKEFISTKDKSESEKRPGKSAVSLRECEPPLPSIPDNFLVPDSEPAIQVALNPFDTKLAKVVSDNAEASNYEATEKPCYTQSGLTEVCVN